MIDERDGRRQPRLLRRRHLPVRGLRTWGEIYRPDVAILGIGGLWLGPVKITELPPPEAAIAARWLGVSTVIPVHHHPCDPDPAQLAAELAGSGIEVAALDFGATWTAPWK